MQMLSEDDLNKMLARAKKAMPYPHAEHTAESILKKAADERHTPGIKFTQLRNTGIAMLLIIAVNVWAIATTVGKKTTGGQQEETAHYLQPYNLNVY